MFEEHDLDLKALKEYCSGKIFDTVVDISNKESDALDCIKCRSGYIFVPEGVSCSNKRYKPMEGSVPPNSADCLLSRDALSKKSDLKQFFSTCSKLLKEKGQLIICSTVTDIEDTYLNTLEFEKDNNHVRHYSVSEIVSAGSEFFRLEFFKEVEKVISLNTWLKGHEDMATTMANKFIAFPETVKEEMKFAYDSKGVDLVGFGMKTGVFVWNKFRP